MRRAAAGTITASAPSGLRAGERLIGTGGSTRTLARLARRGADWPIDRLHGYPLPAATVRGLEGRLAVHTREERGQLDGLRAARADSIVGGAVILDELMRHLGAERLTVAAGGLREGVATRAFGEPVPPPRLVRAAAVEALLRRRGLWRADDMEARAARIADGMDADPFGEPYEAARHAAMLRAIGEADGDAGAGGRAAGGRARRGAGGLRARDAGARGGHPAPRRRRRGGRRAPAGRAARRRGSGPARRRGAAGALNATKAPRFRDAFAGGA